jgi:acetoin:2,6-dichlorophenolindophenol oxidoreductase subunit beta
VSREITFVEALNEAADQCLAKDPAVYLIGLGVPDPKGIFGSTSGLAKKYGPARVMDMPCAENGMTGICLGSSLVGMRPIMTHQRIDFAVLAMEQLVNQAAKWHYMFAGKMRAPMVIRMIMGRGWGQGPQHSQSLQAWFAHVPGLKVVMPATPYDAKGLLIASVEDDNPVVFLEHRWLYGIRGPVPAEVYRVPIGQARVMREGSNLTIVSASYMTLEALRAADKLAEDGIKAEVFDLRTIRPLDEETILKSVRKTGRVIVADTGWKSFGIGAEIVSLAAEKALSELKSPPVRVASPDCPTPTTPALANHYYPTALDIETAARRMFKPDSALRRDEPSPHSPLDVPDKTFTGPF